MYKMVVIFLVLMISSSAFSYSDIETFNIIFVNDSANDSDEFRITVIIDGGYLNGLASGMIGSTKDVLREKETLIKDAVEIISVEDYISTCKMNIGQFYLRNNERLIQFDLEIPSNAESYELGKEALTKNNAALAKYYFINSMERDVRNDSVRDLINRCDMFLQEKVELELAEIKTSTSSIDFNFWTTAGLNSLEYGNLEIAKIFLKRALKADQFNSRTQQLAKLIDFAENQQIIDILLPYETIDFVAVEIQARVIYEYKSSLKNIVAQPDSYGIVWIRSLIDTSGLVIETKLSKSSGVWLIDDLALSDALKFKYEPAIQNGRPVKIWLQHKIEYKLE